jgi:peptide/nickel transport system permease protein
MRVWLPATILIGWALLALVGPMLALQPNDIDLTKLLSGPSAGYWLGNDDLGRSVAERLIVGARTSCVVAFWVVALSALFGTFVGVLSAWFGGVIDHLVVRIVDVFLAFPGILLAIALSGILGPGIENVIFALCAVGWVGFARLARAQTLSVKHREHVLAAIALGSGRSRIICHHIVPYISAPLIVESTFGIAGTVVAEAGLSFLGLGVQPPDASWGTMIRDGTGYLLVAPHLVLAPGLALMLVVLSVNVLGDRLRDHVDVRTRSRD